MYLNKKDKAIDFALANKDGKIIKLSDYLGKKVILYFYPKDNTPGCTKEACAFNDNLVAFDEKNAVILGISMDDVDSHLKFANKFGLNFEILSDPDKKVIEAYGVWQLKKNYGKEYMGIVRTTYVIDEKGYVEDVMKVSTVDGHVEKVLAKLA